MQRPTFNSPMVFYERLFNTMRAVEELKEGLEDYKLIGISKQNNIREKQEERKEGGSGSPNKLNESGPKIYSGSPRHFSLAREGSLESPVQLR